MIGLVFLLALCWGSFLNVVGYRIIRGKSLFGRSRCPYCKAPIAWYDLIPVISWLILQGKCRNCKKPLSILYPLIELLTAFIFSLMVLYTDSHYWLGYGIFFSSLIVTIRTDFERMLISRYMTWGLIPLGIGLALFGLLPITFYQSFTGTALGYGLLWLSATFFKLVRRKDGIGEGDLDLLAMIGAFIGPLGAWISLFLGSFIGSFVGFMVMIRKRRVRVKIAFGPWLAAGAIIYVFAQEYFARMFF